ncbi:MAG: hypothetical protein GY864_12365 [Desulfobacterales bacterium]|nr:hypothetical protein [Desulfobacterales bacterium]
MNNFIQTKSGTVIVDGIEYNRHPPPQSLLKVMDRHWARELREHGLIRFGSPEYYQRWENCVLGDPNDSKGLLYSDGHPYHINSGNPVFVWCMALQDISKSRIKKLAKKIDYNCVIRIISLEELLKRIKRSIQSLQKQFHLQCGKVTYNRGEEMDKTVLNTQKWHFNVFQKSPDFKDDREFRISITDLSYSCRVEQFFKLNVGDCSDIILIEDLPNL